MFRHCLIPTDGSELSLVAARKAVLFAKEMGAKVTAFYVKPEYPVFYFGEGAAFDPSMLDDFTAMAEEHAKKYLGEIEALCKSAGVQCNTLSVTHNIVHEAIINAATEADCDLIFMASHGRSGLSGMLLGSETQKVLSHTKIPVLVYR